MNGPADDTPPGGMPADQDILSLAVESSLQEVMQANGLMLTGVIGLVTFMDLEGTRYMRLLAGADCNEISSLGMARKMTMMIEDQSRATD